MPACVQQLGLAHVTSPGCPTKRRALTHYPCLPACLLQLVVGDSPLNLNLQVMNVNGTFQMGTADCPITSLINVFIPGGNSTFGIYALRPSSYDVHASFTVWHLGCVVNCSDIYARYVLGERSTT